MSPSSAAEILIEATSAAIVSTSPEGTTHFVVIQSADGTCHVAGNMPREDVAAACMHILNMAGYQTMIVNAPTPTLDPKRN